MYVVIKSVSSVCLGARDTDPVSDLEGDARAMRLHRVHEKDLWEAFRLFKMMHGEIELMAMYVY